MSWKWFLILLPCILLHIVSPVEAREEKRSGVLNMLEGEDEDKGPITIESDQASFDKKAGIMIYSGHVVVRRGKMVINSNRLKGFFDENQKELNRMIAEGQVKVVKEDKTLEAQKVTYYRDGDGKERLELEGKPVIYLRENSISADKMIYNLIADKFEAKGHVRSVFYQDSSEASSLPGEKSQKSPLPVTITSENASYNVQNNTARFLHNVKVNRNDVKLSAQELDVFLEKEMGKIEKIVASGQVEISQKDKEISADHGVFFEKEKKVVLTGNPISRQGENVLSGKEIVYYFDSETVEVKKARTILHPRSTEEKSFLLPAPGM